MKFEDINTNTENAIAEIKAAAAKGLLKYESDCFAFLAGYTHYNAIMFLPVWEAINAMVKDGKIIRNY